MTKLQNIVRVLLIFVVLQSSQSFSFPENVRHGYSNCGSCHVSPTGGGVLNEYGRRSGEDFMFTWASENEADFAHGAVKLPEGLHVGGDFRFLSLAKDNRITRSQLGFPMQADLELAYQLTDRLTVAAALGSYDGEIQSRRHYLMYQATDNFYVRAGRFFAAYGIYTPDHAVLTRKVLKFNEGQETLNAEIGYLNEKFELIVDAISSQGGEGMTSLDQGFSARFASYLGKNSQIGWSLMHGKGLIWERDVMGPFAIIGFGEDLHLQWELDYQKRKAVDSTDASLPDHATLLSFTRLGWQAAKGWQLFVSAETLDPQGSNVYTPKQRVFGPGVQWLPRPHLEFVAKFEKKQDEAFAREFGDQVLLVSHYYF